jgi:type II secretory pathway component PulJ
MLKQGPALTLLELLIAISLIAVISIGFVSISIFTQHHVISSDRRAKVQNEVSLVLEHMAKNIRGTDTSGGAIGNSGESPVTTYPGNTKIDIKVDSNNNGRLDDSGVDGKITYEYDANNHNIYFTPAGGTQESLTQGMIVSARFTYNNTDNFIEVQITGRWNPDPAKPASLTNPEVTMTNRINMPSVSLRPIP